VPILREKSRSQQCFGKTINSFGHIHRRKSRGSAIGTKQTGFREQKRNSLKEARETNYRLRLISETNRFEENIEKGITDLIEESEEIKKKIASIIVSAKKKVNS
jgi:hypothetical protein